MRVLLAAKIDSAAVIEALKPARFAPWAENAQALDILAAAFFAAMVALCIGGLFFRLVPVMRRAWELRSALKNAPREPAPAKTTEQWQKDFAAIISVDWLKQPCEEFLEQCWEHRGEVNNAHQADEYFGAEPLDPGQHTLGHAVPGLLTALGILGTFVGIVLGLQQLQIQGADSKAMQDAIGQLVNALGVSFRTSIWGLVLSMGMTSALSLSETWFEVQRRRLVHWIDVSVQRGTVQELLTRIEAQGFEDGILGQIEKAQREAVNELRTLADDIGASFENAIGGPDGNGALIGEIRSMSETLAAVQSEGVGDIVEKFGGLMRDMFGDQFVALGVSIDRMVDAQGAYQNSMGGLVDNLERASANQQQAADRVEKTVQSAGQMLNSVSEGVQNLEQASTRLRENAGAVAELLSGQRAALEDFSRVADTVKESGEAYRADAEQARSAWLEFSAGLREMQGVVRSLTEWHAALRDQLRPLTDEWRDALEVQGRLTARFADERQAIDKLLEKVTTTVDVVASVGDGAVALVNALESGVTTLQHGQRTNDEGVQQALAKLQEFGAQMGDSYKGYVDAAQELQAGLPAIRELLDQVGQGLEAQKEFVSRGLQASAALEQTLSAQTDVRDSLVQVAEANRRTEESLRPASEAIREGATLVRDELAGLRAVRESTVEVARQLQARAEEIRASEAEARDRWEEVRGEMEQTAKTLDDGAQRYARHVNNQLEEVLGQFDAELTRAVTALSTGISGLDRVVNDLRHLQADA